MHLSRLCWLCAALLWSVFGFAQKPKSGGFHEFPVTTKPKPAPAKPQPPTKPSPPSPLSATAPNPFSAQPDPNRVFVSMADSLFVQVDHAQKYLLHRVRAGESLYAIKRFYSLELNDLYYANPDVQINGIRPDQLLRIPILARAIRRTDPEGRFRVSDYIPVYYKVRPAETLYRVAKVHFKMPVETLKARNKLTTDALTHQQTLLIGWIPRTGIPDTLEATGFTALWAEENSRLAAKYELAKSKKQEQSAEGVACWLKGERFIANGELLVLFSDAPEGSAVWLENPIHKRQIYAQVMGPLPKTSTTEGTIILVSPNVAHALGGVDARFPIKVRYFK